MPFDIDKYRRAVEPRDIFELLPRELFVQLNRGFFYGGKKGAAMMYARYDPERQRWVVVDDLVESFDYNHPDDRQFINPVCREYHSKMGGEKCMESNKGKAQECLDGKYDGATIYPCWLGLDDLLYPLKIAGEVRAVLFAGQIVPNNDARLDQIKERVRARCQKNREFADRLCALLEEEWVRQWEDDDNYAQNRAHRLEQFGRMLQRIIDELYDARKHAATQELLQESAEFLASADPNDRLKWWSNCQELLHPFCKFVGLEEIQIYIRQRRFFERQIPLPADAQNRRRVLARDVVPVVPSNTLVPASDSASLTELAESLEVGTQHICFYFCPTEVDSSASSTFVILKGSPSSVHLDLVKDFCQMLGHRTGLGSLVFHLQDVQERFRIEVAEVAHDFRTPTQVIVLELAALLRRPEISAQEELAGQLRRLMVKTIATREYAMRLQKRVTEQRKSINLTPLVREVMSNLEPLAKGHPCMLKKLGKWPDKVMVYADEYRLRHAITNLMDNAIKYTWRGGKRVDFHHELHTVTVQVQERNNHIVCVHISNYGIGVPPDLLQAVRERGQRAHVPDRDRPPRHGTGWGLPIAIQVFEDHGGGLEMTSEPRDSDPRSTGEEHHRFETVVSAYLPVAR